MNLRRTLGLILVLGLVARAALLYYAEQRPELFDFPDSQRYIQVARNIAAGYGPIDNITMPSGHRSSVSRLVGGGHQVGY